MLVVNFVPTFSDNSMLFSAEDVAWQFRGSVVDGRVYVCIDTMLHTTEVVYQNEIVKHLMLQLLMFGVGIEGCPSIDHTFDGGLDVKVEFAVLYCQLQPLYTNDTTIGLVSESQKAMTEMYVRRVQRASSYKLLGTKSTK